MNWRVKSVEASIADSGDEERSLRRSLGTWDLALMGIAVAVGAGIFSVGAQAAANFAGPSVCSKPETSRGRSTTSVSRNAML